MNKQITNHSANKTAY